MKKFIVFSFIAISIFSFHANEKNTFTSSPGQASYGFHNTVTWQLKLLSEDKNTSKDIKSKFLNAAIGFTAADSVCLLAGIAGLIIYGVSLNIIFTSSTVSDGMFYSGISLSALFMSLFVLLLPGVIVFWVFYGIKNKPINKTSSIKFSGNGLTFSLKF
jgi:hypothetical protein